jgi:hypothetical protein
MPASVVSVTVIGIATHQEHAPQRPLAASTPLGPTDGIPAGPTARRPIIDQPEFIPCDYHTERGWTSSAGVPYRLLSPSRRRPAVATAASGYNRPGFAGGSRARAGQQQGGLDTGTRPPRAGSALGHRGSCRPLAISSVAGHFVGYGESRLGLRVWRVLLVFVGHGGPVGGGVLLTPSTCLTTVSCTRSPLQVP